MNLNRTLCLEKFSFFTHPNLVDVVFGLHLYLHYYYPIKSNHQLRCGLLDKHMIGFLFYFEMR